MDNLKIQKVEMEKAENLDYADWNYKDDEIHKMEKFAKSIENNSLTYGLIVAQREETPNDNKWEVCDGNHRLRVLKEHFNLDSIPVYKMGRLSLEERIRISLELNLWSFQTDKVKLSECFETISAFGLDDLQETQPYTESQMQAIIDLKDYDFLALLKQKEEGEENEKPEEFTLEFSDEEMQQIKPAFSKLENELKKIRDDAFYMTHFCKQYCSNFKEEDTDDDPF